MVASPLGMLLHWIRVGTDSPVDSCRTPHCFCEELPNAGHGHKLTHSQRALQVPAKGKALTSDEKICVDVDDTLSVTTLETTQGQMNVFLDQLPFKRYLSKVASVGD